MWKNDNFGIPSRLFLNPVCIIFAGNKDKNKIVIHEKFSKCFRVPAMYGVVDVFFGM